MRAITGKACSVWTMALVFAVGLFAQTPVLAAPASGMVSTQQLLHEVQLNQQRASVSAFLDRSEVQAQLMARGVDVADAQARVASLGAAELGTLAAQIDELPAGEGLLEAVLFLLVIFMLLDIAGVTDIFPGL